MIRRGVRRLMQTGARELADRGVEAVRIAREAAGVATGFERWRRDRLASRLLVHTPELAAARQALGRHDWLEAHRALRSHFTTRQQRFPITPTLRERSVKTILGYLPAAADAAVARASRICQGRYDLLGYSDISFSPRGDGDDAAIDWHFDPVHDRRAPRGEFWKRVRFLDPVLGDHKIIWELNRHQHWLALGRAAWLTGDRQYSRRFTDEFGSWMNANPPLAGINWASMLELGLRSISWIWALHFFTAIDDDPTDADADSVWLVDLLLGLERQVEHVRRHLSFYFSPNTHLLGEALALYVAGRVMPEFTRADVWERLGREILVREADAQVHPDGGHAELSFHYQRYALDFYLLALVVARRSADPVATQFEEVAGRLAGFCRAMADDTGRLPTVGDDDGGQLFPICGRAPYDVADSLSLAAVLLRRPELAVSDVTEEALWMLGGEPSAAPLERLTQDDGGVTRSEIFLNSGYGVLRSGDSRAILDAGRHGFLNGGHAHADALSMVLSLGRHPLIVDPGTGTYTMKPMMRDRFRSTSMHNTVVVDERSQSETDGPFHWKSATNASLERWRVKAGCYAEASHDGYAPLIHRRAIAHDRRNLWLIADHLIGEGRHQVDAYWHIDPDWRSAAPAPSSRAGVSLEHPAGPRAAIVTTAVDVREFYGDPGGLGWCAPVYGRVVPSITLRCTHVDTAPFSIVTAIETESGGGRSATLSIATLQAVPDTTDAWHRVAVLVQTGGDKTLACFAAPLALSTAARSLARIRCDYGELATDARMALLRLSQTGKPEELYLVDGRVAVWAGNGSFAIDLGAPAEDLRFDLLAREAFGAPGEEKYVRHRGIR
jgi:hypothetical protein